MKIVAALIIILIAAIGFGFLQRRQSNPSTDVVESAPSTMNRRDN